AFLMQQMAWREALDEAADATAVQALADRIERDERAMLAELERLLDVQGDTAGAAAQVRSLMFLARFRADIERRLEQLTPS
ncbi:MAG: co-chaperone HscB, partial [Burkholderiales bacterium]|nr:co-chaperone HscB [Burkholderiales bacterium]